MPVLYCSHAQLGNQCMLHLREAWKASQSYCIIVCLSVLSSAAESRGGVKRLVNKSLFRFYYCEQPNQDDTDLDNPLRISVFSGNIFFPALGNFSSWAFMQCKQRAPQLPLKNRENGVCLPVVESGLGKEVWRNILFLLLTHTEEKASSSAFCSFVFLPREMSDLLWVAGETKGTGREDGLDVVIW